MNCQLLRILLFSSMVNGIWMLARECDDSLTGPAGVLHFSDPYTALQSWSFYCEYNVTVKEGTNMNVKIASMSIDSATVECSDSYIMLRDGPNLHAPPLGSERYCGNNTILGPLSTVNNKLHIRTAIKLGLNARYKLIYEQNPLVCGGIYELSPGNLQKVFSSPDPAIRSSPWECVWIFIAPVDQILTMNFTQYNYSSSTNCEEEYIEARNGGTSVSPPVWNSCYDYNKQIITKENLLYVKFYSKLKEPTINFEAIVTAAEDICGGTLRAERGSITSPHYPSTSQNKICKWKIIVPHNKRIVFEFFDLHLSGSANCEQSNYVRISERIPDNGTDATLGTFCGFNKPQIIKTSCNKAFVKFYSSYRSIGRFRGFVLNYTTIDEPCALDCGGVLNSETGIITSPNFCDEYPPNQHCQWKIIVPSQKIIRFDFVRIMIDDSPACTEDYLQIDDVVNGRDVSLGRYCNYIHPKQITTEGSTAKVLFHSNDKNEDSGFLLLYTAVEKPQYVTIEKSGAMTINF